MKKATIIRKLKQKPLLIDIHTHVGTDPVNYLRGDFPYAQSGEDLLVRLDRWGVDVAACFPFLYTNYFDMDAFIKGRMRRRRTTEVLVPYAVENRRLCEEIYEAYPACTGRLLPFAFFDPSRDPADQVKAIERLMDQYPLFGLKTATSYMQSPITDLLGKGACLLDLAAAHDLPVMLHTSVAPGDPWGNVHAILGVVRNRPDVRFCLAHTCRFDRDALEQADALPNCFVDFSAFSIHCDLVQMASPGVAAKPIRFPAAYRLGDKAMGKIAKAFPDTMLWGTDSPYYCFMSRFTDDQGQTRISLLKCDTDAEITTFRKLPKAMQRRIGYTNTINFLFGKGAL